MALKEEAARKRLHQLFAGLDIEPDVSYGDIINAVRRIRPPETVWGLARDLATHLEAEPDSLFPPDEAQQIRRGMAQRWVHGALGGGDERSAREDAVVAAWEGMQFAGVPPLRSAPLRYFSGRHEQESEAVYPLGASDAMTVRIKE